MVIGSKKGFMCCGPIQDRDLGTSCTVTMRDLSGVVHTANVSARSKFEAADNAVVHFWRYCDAPLMPPESERVFEVTVTGRKAYYHPRPYLVTSAQVEKWRSAGRHIAPREQRLARIARLSPPHERFRLVLRRENSLDAATPSPFPSLTSLGSRPPGQGSPLRSDERATERTPLTAPRGHEKTPLFLYEGKGKKENENTR